MHSWYNKLDLPTLLAWLGLITIGLVAIYSTTHGPAATYLLESVQRNFNRQMLWVSVSVIGLVIALFLPVRFFQQGAFIFYAISLLLLVAALLFGREVNGAKSWLPIGPVQVQVSELAKVGTVLAVARLLSLRRPDSNNVRYAVGAVGLLLAPAILIIMQNDTGTALIFLGLVPIMLFWSGLPVETVLLMVSPAIAGYFSIVSLPVALGFSILFCLFIYTRTGERYMVALAGLFTFGTLGAVNFALQSVFQDYQVARILSFTNPEAYSQGVGWHLVQSRAALSGGGLFGKGFMEGPQTQGSYIPEQSTDFVFSVVGEEFGLIGAAAVLLLFALLMIRLTWMGADVKHPFGSIFAVGVVGVFLIHVFVNIGMVTGLLPVIGIPLPFISYGGSAMLANTGLLAIALDLHMRRDDFSIYGY